ncbi:hypothetical protein SSS_09717 [Sarcoptes scabiei]|uniref:Uncharacterized protein n=1 Tax=Sarcoptes scabiei TaxID=52283 RepID=A0A834VEZ6_SARSC|nr:hypothetical protein SSS_09717 [Sarcoptes scabiei]
MENLFSKDIDYLTGRRMKRNFQSNRFERPPYLPRLKKAKHRNRNYTKILRKKIFDDLKTSISSSRKRLTLEPKLSIFNHNDDDNDLSYQIKLNVGIFNNAKSTTIKSDRKRKSSLKFRFDSEKKSNLFNSNLKTTIEKLPDDPVAELNQRVEYSKFSPIFSENFKMIDLEKINPEDDINLLEDNQIFHPSHRISDINSIEKGSDYSLYRPRENSLCSHRTEIFPNDLLFNDRSDYLYYKDPARYNKMMIKNIINKSR